MLSHTSPSNKVFVDDLVPVSQHWHLLTTFQDHDKVTTVYSPNDVLIPAEQLRFISEKDLYSNVSPVLIEFTVFQYLPASRVSIQ